jgi:putative ABC transport system ATP-binding protein
MLEDQSKVAQDDSMSHAAIPVQCSDNMLVLRRFAKAMGLSFDAVAAERALRHAERDVPPTNARAARLRMAQAAETLGFRLQSRKLSVREAFAAVSLSTPLALFSLNADGSARWYMLVRVNLGQGQFEQFASDPSEPTWSADQFARLIGVSDLDVVVEWFSAEPIDSHSAEPTQDHGHDVHHVSHGLPPATRLWSLIHAEKRDVSLVVLYAIGVGILSLAIPITAMAVVNTTALATLLQQLIVLCLALFLSLSVASLLRSVQTVIVEYLQQRVFVRVVSDLAYRLPRVDLRAFDRQHGPELVNRFFDVLTVQKAASTLLLDGVAVVLQMGIGLLLLAFYHHLLLGFALVLVAGLAFIVFVLGNGAMETAIRESRAKYLVAGWMEEIARHPAAFKLHGGPTFAQERADAHARAYLSARQEHFRILLRQFVFALLLQVGAHTALLGLGGYLVIAEQLTLGQLVAAEIVVTLVVASFTKLGKQLENYYDLLAAVDKLGHLLELPLERQTGEAHHGRTGGAAVRLHNVSFTYESGRRQILDCFNLELTPGERLAVVGPNGAGKSTLVDLLFGTRAPTGGYVTIDGADVRDLRLQSLRENIAMVKGIEIFDGTVLENVRMGRDEMSVADVRHALASVGLLEDILDLPDGLNTPLRTGGTPLSLGQCERLMLARAIAGQPRLLILDETLDDMDKEVRNEVMPVIFARDKRWTLLVITHSQDVANMCDRQVLIRKSIIESLKDAARTNQHSADANGKK